MALLFAIDIRPAEPIDRSRFSAGRECDQRNPLAGDGPFPPARIGSCRYFQPAVRILSSPKAICVSNREDSRASVSRNQAASACDARFNRNFLI